MLINLISFFPGPAHVVAGQVPGLEPHRERVGGDGGRVIEGPEGARSAAAQRRTLGGRAAQVGGAAGQTQLLREACVVDAKPSGRVCGGSRWPHELLRQARIQGVGAGAGPCEECDSYVSYVVFVMLMTTAGLVKAVSAAPTKSDRGQVAPHCLPC